MTMEQEPSMTEKGLSPTSKEVQTDEEKALLTDYDELDDLQSRIENASESNVGPEELLLMQDQFEAKKKETELIEQNFLGTANVAQENPQLQKIDILQPDQQEFELKEEREKFVNEYIDAEVQKALDEWRTYLDESVNSAKAERIIALKSEQIIMKEAKQFIEEGGGPNFGGGEAELELCYFDGPEGRVQYVTGFEWRTAAGAGVDLERDDMTKNDQKSQEELTAAEEQGELKQKSV